jgi:dTDP-4-dehydrorhamnose reductase
MLGVAFEDVLKMFGLGENVIRHSPDFKIEDYNDVSNLKVKIKPNLENIILHCAGIVDVEYCEKHPTHARKVFIDGTENILKLADDINAKILFPQSFLIYDGLINPVDELTKPSPLNTYAKLKLEAEQLLRQNDLIIRMGGFFGGYNLDKNFVGMIIKKIFNSIKSNQSFFEIGDRHWQPTYTLDLAYNSLALINQKKQGVYNMSSLKTISFYDLGCLISKFLGFDKKIKLKKISNNKFKNIEIGERPYKIEFNCNKLKNENLYLIDDIEISLKKYLSSEYFNRYKI